jgi:hypothetical protein
MRSSGLAFGVPDMWNPTPPQARRGTPLFVFVGTMLADARLPMQPFSLVNIVAMAPAEPYARIRPTAVPSARQVALDLLGAVLRRRRPLDDAIEDHDGMSELSARDRAFARFLAKSMR